jgi:hypothetical protein
MTLSEALARLFRRRPVKPKPAPLPPEPPKIDWVDEHKRLNYYQPLNYFRGLRPEHAVNPPTLEEWVRIKQGMFGDELIFSSPVMHGTSEGMQFWGEVYGVADPMGLAAYDVDRTDPDKVYIWTTRYGNAAR